MNIGGFDLDKDILIIAEIGNNHEGNFDLAREMVSAAAQAGAKAVKFQAVRAEHLVDPRNEARYQQVKKFELTYEQFASLAELARSKGMIFLCTPFDLEGVGKLNPLVPAFKISSGDNNFYPLLETVARTGKPVILSSGLADLKQIKRSKAFIEKIWKKKKIKQAIAVLHCVTSYPVPMNEANLNAISSLRKALKCLVGYSDHTLGIEASVLSVALGARIIEKHFTLNKQQSAFRDHELSADPKEMAELVRKVKETVQMLGSGAKTVQSSEAKNVQGVRRSIVAARDLPAETKLKFEDLNWLRLPEGLPPGTEDKVLGKKLLTPLKKGELILAKALHK